MGKRVVHDGLLHGRPCAEKSSYNDTTKTFMENKKASKIDSIEILAQQEMEDIMPCGDLMMLTKQGIINIMVGQCWMIKTTESFIKSYKD